MKRKVVQSDIVEWARAYRGPRMMACLCDPPFDLTDRDGWRGFRRKKWDSTGIAFDPGTWKAIAGVPFAGSGSEMIGAALAGWEEVTGVEMEAEYCAMGEARLAYWSKANMDCVNRDQRGG